MPIDTEEVLSRLSNAQKASLLSGTVLLRHISFLLAQLSPLRPKTLTSCQVSTSGILTPSQSTMFHQSESAMDPMVFEVRNGSPGLLPPAFPAELLWVRLGTRTF